MVGRPATTTSRGGRPPRSSTPTATASPTRRPTSSSTPTATACPTRWPRVVAEEVAAAGAGDAAAAGRLGPPDAHRRWAAPCRPATAASPSGVDVDAHPDRPRRAAAGRRRPGRGSPTRRAGAADGAAGQVLAGPLRALPAGRAQSASARPQSVPRRRPPDGDGRWLFSDVAVGQTYEVSFAPARLRHAVVRRHAERPTASRSSSPSSCSRRRGSVSGVVAGPGGALGNVELVLTDGTLTFQSSSASGAGAGDVLLHRRQHAGHLHAARQPAAASAPRSLQVTLEPGEQRDRRATSGCAPASARSAAGSPRTAQPLGGVTLTASNGDTTVETTSLTEGDTGSYTFPQLAIPGRYTVTASLDGLRHPDPPRRPQRQRHGRRLRLPSRRRARSPASSRAAPAAACPGANIRVSRDELAFDTETRRSARPRLVHDPRPPARHVPRRVLPLRPRAAVAGR